MKNNYIYLALTLIVFSGYINTSFAQPANNNCASATALTIDAAPIAGTSAAATVEVGEPTPSCGLLKQSVWYKFTATAASHAVSLNKTGGGCLADMAVYSGACFGFAEIGSNCSVSSGSNPNVISLNGLTIGTTYYIQLVYNNGGPCGASWTWNIQVITCTGSAKTWVTTGTTAWGTASNWSPAGVPTICDNVTIPSGGTQPTVSAAANCKNLTVNAGALLTVSSNLNIYGNLLNNGNMNDGVGYTNLYGNGCTWGGTGTFMNGAAQEGWICMKDGSNYTLINNIQPVDKLGGTSITTATNGILNLGPYTLTIATGGVLYNIFYLNYNTGMVNLGGGGSIDVSKSNYGTGVLWVNSAVNGFGFNLEDDYYSVWFNNSAGTTKFGKAAIDVYVKQDLWIRSPCTLDLSASGSNAIVVGHDFINDDVLSAATSFIRMEDFNVAQAQNITSTNGTITTFNGLEINNSGPGVFLQLNSGTNATATGTLKMTNGPLYLNGYRFTVQRPATAAITRTGGRVVSENNVAVNPSILQWNIGATTGAHVFPFGTAGGSYIPVTFNNSGAVGNVSIATRPTVNACAAPVGANGTCNQPWAGASNVAAVSSMGCPALGGDCSIYSAVDRFWDITSSSASPLASAVTLSLTYMGAENTITTPGQTLGFQHWNGSLWNAGTAAGTAAGTYVSSGSAGQTTAGTPYTVTGSGFVYFSPYILVGTDPDVPLPVELLSFTADCKGDKVIANWETASEKNNNYFTLEKSLDGISFISVAKVDGAGNSSTVKKYSAVDTEPCKGTCYYRLRQTDFNGQTETFNVIVIEGCGNNNGFAVYPNPSTQGGSFNVSVSGTQGDNVLIVVRDLFGREFYSQVILLSNDAETIAIDPSGKLTSGVYFVTASSNDAIYKKKLVIK